MKLPLYYSVNVNDLKTSKKIINLINNKDYVFISLHVAEENNKDYIKNTIELCNLLKIKHARAIADISPRTLKMFKSKDYLSLSKKLEIYAYRVDNGFAISEIIKLAKKMVIVINASTFKISDLIKVKKVNKSIFAMFNFYPRPETGIDLYQFVKIAHEYKKIKIPLYAFISGDLNKRGPLFMGLPTLEFTRDLPPYVSYVLLNKSKLLDGVFVGDIGLKEDTIKRIDQYQKDGVIHLKAKLLNADLYNKKFTNRIDSPLSLIRILESREYASVGHKVKPNNIKERIRGSISIDNERYQRYSGEIMIYKKDYPLDQKVNVIGNVDNKYLLLLDLIKGDDQFVLIKD